MTRHNMTRTVRKISHNIMTGLAFFCTDRDLKKSCLGWFEVANMSCGPAAAKGKYAYAFQVEGERGKG